MNPLPAPMQAAALAAISAWPDYAPTPLGRLPGGILYKDEASRFGLGSFKALGGSYAVSRIARGATVTTATAGNHGRSVAWGAARFGCEAVIYVPRTCSEARERAIADLGARVIRTTLDYDDTVRLCAADAAGRGWLVISDTSWEAYEEIPATIMAGYTVCAAEAAEQLGSPPTHVFVQAGVGGLACAVCAHFWLRWGRERPVFIVVEPENAACHLASARAGRPARPAGAVHSLMAGLNCAEVSPLAWRLLDCGADFFVTVPDTDVEPAMRALGEHGISAGPSGVAGFVAATNESLRVKLGIDESSRVLVFGTEGAESD